MKHVEKQISEKRIRLKKIIIILLLLLIIALAGLALSIYMDYQANPGSLEKIWITEKGTDYITVAWERPRNVYKYAITCNGNSISVNGTKDKIKLSNLSEGTDYEISVRADSLKREGATTLTARARTKSSQRIEGADVQMKFINTLVDLKQSAETNLSYSSDDNTMSVIGDKVMFTKPGDYTVKVTAEETEDFISASKEITVTVLDSVKMDMDGATPHIFYKLDKKNCELVMTIKGDEKASTPQSFEYAEGKYIVLYGSKDDKVQRIITFEDGGNKKEIIKSKIDLGHCNGLTVANGIFYEVKGSSLEGVSFNLSEKKYDTFKLPYLASGIAYDTRADLFYVSQFSGLTTYDKEFNPIRHFPRVKRKDVHYSQDCGAYSGIMMHCVSGADFQGTNYIDFYDMLHEKYLGSIECDLNEVESLIVNEDGYIELLCNTKKLEDCIWRTPINMKILCD